MTNKIFAAAVCLAFSTATGVYAGSGDRHAVKPHDSNLPADGYASDNLGLADTSRVFDLDEVVIVSQPKEVLRLRRQPLSSSVLSGRDLYNIGVRDLTDLS